MVTSFAVVEVLMLNVAFQKVRSGGEQMQSVRLEDLRGRMNAQVKCGLLMIMHHCSRNIKPFDGIDANLRQESDKLVTSRMTSAYLNVPIAPYSLCKSPLLVEVASGPL